MSLMTKRRWPRTAALASLTLAVSAAGLTVPAAAVAPDSPAGLSATPGERSPSLSWDHVMRATGYEVQVDDDADFTSPVPVLGTATKAATKNNVFVPTQVLPRPKAGDSQLYWRVRAATGSEWSEWSSDTVDVGAGAGGPALENPGPGISFENPISPYLSWEPVPGATGYRVEVAANPDFIDAAAYAPRTTSLALTSPPADGTWYWRVRGQLSASVVSAWSATGTFTMKPLPAPRLVSPADNVTAELQDVVLDWDPVPGAKSYDLQIAVNADFTTIVKSETKLVSSRYSPSVTIRNNQYFWRVAARDMNDRLTAWSQARSGFNRTWPHVPKLVHPAAPGTEDVTGTVYFEWEPIPLASEYELQLGTDENFSPGTFEACRVAGTNYSPGLFALNHNTGMVNLLRQDERCRVPSGINMYWRVRGLDRPADTSGITGIYSETQSFRYEPLSITNMTPSSTAPVTDGIPTLRWKAKLGAETYDVTIRNAQGGFVESVTTRSTSYTPVGDPRLNPSEGPFTWSIRANSAAGGKSLLFTREFTISGQDPTTGAAPLTPLSPTPATTGIQEAPELRWEPHPQAMYYRVNVGPASDGVQTWFGSSNSSLFGDKLSYPRMTDNSATLLQPGKYDWQVEAYDANGVLLGAGQESRFTVEALPAVTGHAVALGGRAAAPDRPSDAPDPCTGLSGRCEASAMPILTWNADPYASYYMVYVAEDASFTNLLEPLTAIPATTGTTYFPTLSNRVWSYPDNEAGEAFHWFIRPCRSDFTCGPAPTGVANASQHSFVKRSLPVASPTATPVGNGEVTLSWEDYLTTNLRPANVWAQTGEQPYQSGMQYRVQVSDGAAFNTLLTNQLVDQTTFTALTRMYPQDRPLHWRVQAVDSYGNGLSWSQVQTFTATADPVTLNSLAAPDPSGPVKVSGSPVFSWQPVSFNGTYDLEILQGTNRVVLATGLKATSYVTADPLAPGSYTWRVRANNSSGFTGNWSAAGAPEASFQVRPGKVTTVTPASGATVDPDGSVLSWDASAVPDAATFAVQYTAPSGSTKSVTTSATSFAVPDALASGRWTWKVTALGTAKKELAVVSDVFVVDAALTAVEAPTVLSPEGTAIGRTVHAQEPVWNKPLVSNSYQWLREGRTINGATSTSYTITSADYGRQISVRVTGARAGYTTGVTLSSGLHPESGSALVVSEAPVLTGTFQVGQIIKVTKGEWAPTPSAYKYVWLRDGVAMGPASIRSSYRLATADAGRRISVTVYATLAGHEDGEHTVPAVAVPKVRSTVTASLPVTKVKASKKAKISFRVTASGVSAPTGSVRIFNGTRRIKTVTLGTAARGQMTVTLPKLAKGKRKLRVQYMGNANVASSRSKIVVLKVV